MKRDKYYNYVVEDIINNGKEDDMFIEVPFMVFNDPMFKYRINRIIHPNNVGLRYAFFTHLRERYGCNPDWWEDILSLYKERLTELYGD